MAAHRSCFDVLRGDAPARSVRRRHRLRSLSDLARSNPPGFSLAAGEALDAASATLSALAFFGDPALLTLRSLVAEGLRLRFALTAIHGCSGARSLAETAAAEAGERALELAAVALVLAARGSKAMARSPRCAIRSLSSPPRRRRSIAATFDRMGRAATGT